MKSFAKILALAAVAMMTACQSDDFTDELASKPLEPEPATAFQWIQRAEDVETRSRFLRNYGVGFSYDAINGKSCNWEDIRCQIVDRAEVEKYNEKHGGKYFSNVLGEYVTTTTKTEYSKRDYVANMSMQTKQKVDLGLYANEKRDNQKFIENGVQEKFYFQTNERIVIVNAQLDYRNVLRYYWSDKNMLTPSFRNAVAHIMEDYDNDPAVIDTFINIYGTHVVVQSQLGGTLKIDLMNSIWRYRDEASDTTITTERFMNAVNSKEEDREKSGFVWLKESKINISSRGGDQEHLTGILGEFNYDGSRQFSFDGLTKWRKSIHFDEKDESNSNIEMIDMSVAPIWEFVDIINTEAALRVRSAIEQDVSIQRKLLGENNFFDCRFPISYPTAKCKWRKATGEWITETITDSEAEPIVVNIESGGRYVAMVTHEKLDLKDAVTGTFIRTLRLWTCYPIYEGKVNLACGVGIDEDDVVYSVKWLNGELKVEKMYDATSDGYFCINKGKIDVVTPDPDTVYPDSHPIAYMELCGGVQPDGSYSSTANRVLKNKEEFYIPKTGLTKIVGFEADEGNGRWKRSSDYTYIYNKNEITYAQ